MAVDVGLVEGTIAATTPNGSAISMIFLSSIRLTTPTVRIGRISDHLDEPDWLRDLRTAWWERAESTPPPSGQEEEWRRVDLTGLPRDASLLLDAPRLEAALPEHLAGSGIVLSDLEAEEELELVEDPVESWEPADGITEEWNEPLSLEADEAVG